MNRLLLICSFLLVTTACVGKPAKLPPCDDWATDGAICGRMNPEDLAFLSGGDWIVASEMAFVDHRADPDLPPTRPGRLTAIRVSDREAQRIFPTEWTTTAERTPGWGSEACTTPPDPDLFQPHGLDVGEGPGGRPTIVVVNHGGREAVEFFEVVSASEPAIEWRGCVTMPAGILTNDVALLDGGSFFVTNMMPPVEGAGFGAFWAVLKISFGGSTGSVLHWTPDAGLREVANSVGSAPNGIESAPDGTEIFVAAWGGKKIYRLKLVADAVPQRDEVPVRHRPDNFTWTRDGGLLVAGQHGGPLKTLACGSIRSGGCDIGYSVYAIDPSSLEARKIDEGRGAASVALEVGDEIFIGVFAGDQISRVPAAE